MTTLDKIGLPLQKAAQLNKKGIWSVEELASFYPRKYYDFRKVTPIDKLIPGEYAVVKGKVTYKNDRTPATVEIEDADGNIMYVSWFGSSYIFNVLEEGKEYCFCGKISEFNMAFSISNPIKVSSYDSALGIMPVYSKVKGMSNEYLENSISSALSYIKASYRMSEKDSFAKSLGLMGYVEALYAIHSPKTPDEYKAAKQRIAFNAIYDFYEDIKRKNEYRLASSIGPFKKYSLTKKFIDELMFELTEGQKDVLHEIFASTKAGERVNSIISGDVGCGKTIIAVIASVLMHENGYQTVIAAPTQVLASQHWTSFSSYLCGYGINIEFLVGTTGKKRRKEILEKVKSGEVDILIGTHAVFSEDIEFANLGLTIIDEEHKFGVTQKNSMEKGDKEAVHHLSMTATPIPRSIAKVLYGNESSVLQIKTMPKGRKETITTHVRSFNEAFDKIREEVKNGHQAYVVCPFIEDSENEKFKGVVSVDSAMEAFKKYRNEHEGFDPAIRKISGDMKQKDIDEVIRDFEVQLVDVLFSTTIVEVGVNIPNATVIAVMSADRFGLASLHQLRGRIGRGSAQGYCILVSKENSERLDIMEKTSDGFKIAEEDLSLRGPGDILGVEQTGANKTIDEIMLRPMLAEKVRSYIFSS